MNNVENVVFEVSIQSKFCMRKLLRLWAYIVLVSEF